MKVVINVCFGGFGLDRRIFDELGIKWTGYGYLENKDLGLDDDLHADAYRADKRLIAAIEKYGCSAASGSLAELKIVEIPDGVSWFIDEYDGSESIHEQHREWF